MWISKFEKQLVLKASENIGFIHVQVSMFYHSLQFRLVPRNEHQCTRILLHQQMQPSWGRCLMALRSPLPARSFFFILELWAAGAMQHFLCGGMILFGRLESSGWRQLWDCVWWRVQRHTRIWGIRHSKKNLYNVDAFINFCHVYFLCICLLSPFILVPQIAGLFQATDPSRQA